MTAEQRLTQRIVEALARNGIEAIVTVDGKKVRLEGMIGSAEMRDAVTDIAQEVAPGATIDNQLEVIPILPLPELPADEPENDPLETALRELDSDSLEQIEEEQRVASSDPDNSPRDPGSAEPVFAPTDPVVRDGPHGLEVLGGFADSSVDEVMVEDHDLSGVRQHTRGDEEITDDVVRELSEDAATVDLNVHVHVVNGTVRLTGVVSSLADADAAEEVAGRVPGVVEVDERLKIAGAD